MHPIYFGTSDNPLFGVYYMPQTLAVHPRGVVLCYPFGQEYLWMHRAYRQLATLFSRAGFHVLRFDYTGCGDSAGEAEAGTVARWLDDIAVAIDELKESGALEKVTLAGFRLGGTLAAFAASERDDIESVILWDPILRGRDYLNELQRRHAVWMENNLPDRGSSVQDNGGVEVIGFPLSQKLQTGLQQMDLFKLENAIAAELLVLETVHTVIDAPSQRELARLTGNLTYETFTESDEWLQNGGMNPLLLPNDILHTMVSWASGRDE